MKTSEYSIGSKSPTAANTFLMSINRQNLSALLKALHRMEQYWAGVSYVSEVLEQRVSGLNLARDHSKGPFIALPDNGILRRYTGEFTVDLSYPLTRSDSTTSPNGTSDRVLLARGHPRECTVR